MASDSISATTCPLCGSYNRCAVAEGKTAQSCWCMQATISPDALARIPPHLCNVACICPRCATNNAPIATVQEFDPHA